MACNAPTFPVVFTENDTGPAIVGVIRNGMVTLTAAGKSLDVPIAIPDDAPDISAWTIVLSIDRPGTVLIKGTDEATEGAASKFTVTAFTDGNLVVGKGQLCEIQTTNVDLIITSDKFRIDVVREIV